MSKLKEVPTLYLLPKDTGQALRLEYYHGDPCSLFHYHVEFELVLTRGSIGRRIVGDNISSYSDSDLILLGPNVPHAWISEPNLNQGCEKDNIVIQFTMESLCFEFLLLQEMKGIRDLLECSNRGLYFDNMHAQAATELMGRLPNLDPCARLITVLTVLEMMSTSKYVSPIASKTYKLAGCAHDHAQYTRILEYIHRESERPILLSEAAAHLCMSVPTFVRFFRRMSGTSFVDYLQEWRIMRACTLLVETDQSVFDIGNAVGFNNATNFHRQFLLRRGLTPRDYRRAHSINKMHTYSYSAKNC